MCVSLKNGSTSANQSQVMEFVTTQRGARSLIHEGHNYLINRKGRDGCNFLEMCPKQTMQRNTDYQRGNNYIYSRSDEHNQPPDDAEIVASMAVEKMKQQVQEKINPVPGIYKQQLRELSTREDVDQVAANLPTFPSLKSSLYRLQHKHLPPIPTTREEVCFVENGPRLLKERTFYLLWSS